MIHPKLSTGIEQLWVREPFYAQMATLCDIKEENIETACVYITKKAMVFAYSKAFVDSLTQPQVNYLILHEMDHLLSNHHARFVWSKMNPHLGNIAADMIINSHIESTKGMGIYLEPPTQNRLLVPKEYTDDRVLEPLYAWLYQQCEKNGSDGEEHGKHFDEHKEDEVTPEEKQAIISDLVAQAKARGTVTREIEELLSELQRKQDNPLKKLKGEISQQIKSKKSRTWTRPSLIKAGKGFKRNSTEITCVLDTSGSMAGTFESVMSYLLIRDIQINLIQIDTEIKSVTKIRKESDVKTTKIKGHGGTIIQPGIDYALKHFRNQPLVILTDGFTDHLNVKGFKNTVLIGTTSEVPNVTGSYKVFQIKK